jgi:glutamyl-tRNA synthetase/glutamyl-Q tRNA(Asp) synthetase
MIAKITAKIRQNSTTRFAPSPTGQLHLGHVASAIFVWGVAGACGAKVLLRSEDHDQSRARRPHELSIFNDLAWLGLVHANTEFTAHTTSDFRQSDATARYHAAVAALKKSFFVYGCDCSRQQISREALENPTKAPPTELCYSGRCRSRGLDLDAPGVGWRVVIEDDIKTFNDLLLGLQQQRPARQCGDLLLRDRHGHFTYNFAVVVDDMHHGINLVIRGQDLTAATGRQLWLTAALGGNPQAMQYLHHPLLKDQQGQKLSKRLNSEGLAARRARGESPQVVLGLAAWMIGLQKSPQSISAAELPNLFEMVSHV